MPIMKETRGVTSSNMKSFTWATPNVGSSPNVQVAGATLGTLEVEFLNGSAYEYSGVPYSVFDGVTKAPSVGAAFHVAIKGGSYPVRQTRAPSAARGLSRDEFEQQLKNSAAKK